MKSLAFALLILLAGCSQEPEATSSTKDVLIADNGGNVVSFDLLKGTLFFEDGWIVWDGKASEDGETASIVHRKIRYEDLSQRLAANLAGTPYAQHQELFMTYLTDDRHVYMIDVQQKTVRTPDGVMWTQQTSLAQIAISAVKAVSTYGVLDNPT